MKIKHLIEHINYTQEQLFEARDQLALGALCVSPEMTELVQILEKLVNVQSATLAHLRELAQKHE